MSLGATFSSWVSNSLLGRQNAMSPEEVRSRDAAIDKISELRDVNKLKSDYAQEEVERLINISSSGGEERLKTLIVGGDNPDELKQLHKKIEHALRHLLFPGAGFKAYVEHNEQKVQKQLKLVAEIEGKGPANVDAELQKQAKIPSQIKIRKLASYTVYDSEDLTRFAQILIGDGTEKNPGFPSAFQLLIDKVSKENKLAALNLTVREIEGVTEDDPRVNGYSRFTQNAAENGPSEALSKLRDHFMVGHMTKRAYRKV